MLPHPLSFSTDFGNGSEQLVLCRAEGLDPICNLEWVLEFDNPVVVSDANPFVVHGLPWEATVGTILQRVALSYKIRSLAYRSDAVGITRQRDQSRAGADRRRPARHQGLGMSCECYDAVRRETERLLPLVASH